jgi:hypothetical protein
MIWLRMRGCPPPPPLAGAIARTGHSMQAKSVNNITMFVVVRTEQHIVIGSLVLCHKELRLQ